MFQELFVGSMEVEGRLVPLHQPGHRADEVVVPMSVDNGMDSPSISVNQAANLLGLAAGIYGERVTRAVRNNMAILAAFAVDERGHLKAHRASIPFSAKLRMRSSHR